MENNTIESKDWIIILLSIAMIMVLSIIGISRGIQGFITWKLEAVGVQPTSSNKRRTHRMTKRIRTYVPYSDRSMTPPVASDGSDTFTLQGQQSHPSQDDDTSMGDHTTVTIHGLAPPNTPFSSDEEY